LPAVAAVRILDSLIKVYSIDTTRLYVGGLSWGGIGTQGIMMSYPNKFAAAFPCAGENYRDSVPIMTKTPFWLWHGLADGTVPCKPDTQLVSAVIKAGTPVVKFVTGWTLSTLTFTPQGISVDSLNRAIARGSNYLATWIPGGNHNSGWQTCFYSPSFVPWLMSKSRVNGQSVFTWPAPGPAGTTAINGSAKQIIVRNNFSAGSGIIRWQGVTALPAHFTVFSARGSIMKRYSIASSTGQMKCFGLPAGVYMVKLEDAVYESSRMMVVGR
jgi:hypothetical protein